MQKPWSWLEIWRNAFLRPTLETYARIGNNPRVGMQWGLVWAAVAALVNWLVGPLNAYAIGMLVNTFGGGRNSFFNLTIFGAPVAALLGVLGLAVWAALLHGLARLFGGEGTFQRLFFSWGVMQLPFLVLIGLVNYLPSLFAPSAREFAMSTVGIILSLSKLLIVLGIYLYLFYAQVVAFSAVEGFGIGKGFGILILGAFVTGLIASCLSSGLERVVMDLLRY